MVSSGLFLARYLFPEAMNLRITATGLRWTGSGWNAMVADAPERNQR
jgi:hypothetical protein